MDSDFHTALDPVHDAELLTKALVQRSGYDFSLSEAPETFVALVNGVIPIRITFNNTTFWLDEADTTTPNDGVTVIRTADDYCYKVEDIDMRVRSVLSFTTTAPPVSPPVGDSYLVPAGATGAWSSHQDDITTYTPRGWVFEIPVLGRQLQVEDTNGMARYSATGWVYGYGSQAFDAASIPFSAALGWGARFEVVNQSTTTPPTATKGLRYVVGPSATGAWLGKDKQIAICEVPGTWTFYAPGDGYTIYDKALASDYRYNLATTSWVSASGVWVGSATTGLTLTGTTTAPTGTSAYTYSNGTAPTTSNRRLIDGVVLPFTAKRSGSRLRFHYSADLVFSNGSTGAGATGNLVVAIFRDSVTSALAWQLTSLHKAVAVLAGNGGTVEAHLDQWFEIASPDAASHNYFIAITSMYSGTTALTDASSLTRRVLEVEEAA